MTNERLFLWLMYFTHSIIYKIHNEEFYLWTSTGLGILVIYLTVKDWYDKKV